MARSNSGAVSRDRALAAGAPVRFDAALPTLVRYLLDEQVDVAAGVFLRDGFGRIAFYADRIIPTRALRAHQRLLHRVLGPVSFPAGALQDRNSPGAGIISDPAALPTRLTLGENVISVRLIDRRFFGRDWLQTPSGAIGGLPPLMTFGSLKGGVGRTTAIFVLAMELSRQGANVLLIDLDLEAPGLGSLIFEKDERPEFGVLDFLVENGLGGVSDAALASFVGTSRLTDLDSGAGRVDLVPATGAATIRAPENMLAKLARGMVEDLSGEGPPVSLSGQIRTLVQRMAGRAHYDAVLVDARAGLSELTAGPLLALGGTILLFATDHPHTFEGYRYLMAHLATLPVPSDVDDWRRRIHFVHSMSSASPKDQENFNDKLFDLLAETFYEEDQDDEVFTFSLNEEDAPHRAWRIFFDGQFQGLDPLKDPQVLEQRIHKAVFGDFLESSIDDLFSPAGVD